MPSIRTANIFNNFQILCLKDTIFEKIYLSMYVKVVNTLPRTGAHLFFIDFRYAYACFYLYAVCS
jgi:hypothetical protein